MQAGTHHALLVFRAIVGGALQWGSLSTAPVGASINNIGRNLLLHHLHRGGGGVRVVGLRV